MTPNKWQDVYPHGTKEGDEEYALFIALDRSQYNWRSISGLAKETGLTKERVEEILNKYYKFGMVFPNPKKDDDQWAYWERVRDLLPKPVRSIAQKDQDDRLKKGQRDDLFCAEVSDTVPHACMTATAEWLSPAGNWVRCPADAPISGWDA